MAACIMGGCELGGRGNAWVRRIVKVSGGRGLDTGGAGLG